MEIINVFFYKLSGKILAFWDSIKAYYYGTSNDEKIILFALIFVVLVFLYIVFILILRSNFNRRIKKLGFVNVVHINTANEVHDKNLFLRFFLFFWNFKKLTIVEAKPLVVVEPLTIESPEEEKLGEAIDVIDEEIVQEVENQTTDSTSEVFVLSDDIEKLIEKRFEELTKTMQESINSHLSNLEKDKKAIKKTVVLEEQPVTDAPQDEFKEEIKEEKQINPVVEKETEAFFDKVVVKKYIVRKHPISGWQLIKEGSKRATKIFNTKKQAVAFAKKSNYDFIVL